jgi:transketolase
MIYIYNPLPSSFTHIKFKTCFWFGSPNWQTARKYHTTPLSTFELKRKDAKMSEKAAVVQIGRRQKARVATIVDTQVVGGEEGSGEQVLRS